MQKIKTKIEIETKNIISLPIIISPDCFNTPLRYKKDMNIIITTIKNYYYNQFFPIFFYHFK